MTPDDILREVLTAPRRAYVSLPGQRVIDRPDWFQIVTPSLRDGVMNRVELAVLSEADADAAIDATIAEYRGLGCKFRWVVGPESAPADLGERLARRGLERRLVAGMARAPQGDLDVPRAADVVIERVTRATLEPFIAVMAAGWGDEPAQLRELYELELERDRQALYLAHVAGEPAGGAATSWLARSVYLRGGVVLPRFRGRGVYRELVRARLADAAAAGRELATSHAVASTSAPLLARLGFTEVARFATYRG